MLDRRTLVACVCFAVTLAFAPSAMADGAGERPDNAAYPTPNDVVELRPMGDLDRVLAPLIGAMEDGGFAVGVALEDVSGARI